MGEIFLTRTILHISFVMALIAWGAFKMQGKHSIHAAAPPPQWLYLQFLCQITFTCLSAYAAFLAIMQRNWPIAILYFIFGTTTSVFAWQIWRRYRGKDD